MRSAFALRSRVGARLDRPTAIAIAPRTAAPETAVYASMREDLEEDLEEDLDGDLGDDLVKI